MVTLTDGELALVQVLQVGGSLLTGPHSLVLVEGEEPASVSSKVWRRLYELDLIRRGQVVSSEYRLYYLTEGGKAVDTEAKSQ